MKKKEIEQSQPQVEPEIKAETEKPFNTTQGKPKKKKRPLQSLLNFLVYVVIIVGIVYGLPKFLVWKLKTNYPMAAITSGSMWPVLKTGDLVFIKGVENQSQIQLKDIIVFRNRTTNTLTIHRVVNLSETKITTKGDANFSEDTPINFSDVIGKTLVWRGGPLHVPYLGSITVFINDLIKTKNGGGTGEKN